MSRGVTYTAGLVMNRPALRPITIAFRLYQAGMWRDQAMVLSGLKPTTRTGVHAEWLLVIGRTTLADSIRRARVNLYLARRLSREVSRRIAQ